MPKTCDHDHHPQLDPIGKIPEFKFCAARIEPVKEFSDAAE